MTEQEDANRKLAATLLSHYGDNDHQGILGCLTENCLFKIGAGESEGVVPYHGIHQGHAQIAGYLRKRQSNMQRNKCELTPPGGGSEPTPAPGEPSSVPSQERAHPRVPLHKKLLVHGDTVVAIGHLVDHFDDGSHLHESDFVIVFRIDEKQRKIRSFEYFVDTAAIMQAWNGRSEHPGRRPNHPR
jgi:hypothetical protein